MWTLDWGRSVFNGGVHPLGKNQTQYGNKKTDRFLFFFNLSEN